MFYRILQRILNQILADPVKIHIIRNDFCIFLCKLFYKLQLTLFHMIMHICKDLFYQTIQFKLFRMQFDIAAACFCKRKQAVYHFF